ncbi:hypothetical protein K8R42_01190, partial [bacterium]|nr:hypothetical protein [bacterium]
VKFNSDLSIAARKVYGGADWDLFKAVSSDGTYTYAVGDTRSEGEGNYDWLIVKFNNSDLSIAARKTYGNASGDYTYGVASDGTYIYVEGVASIASGGLIVKFNSDLSIAARKGLEHSEASGLTFEDVHYGGGYTWVGGPHMYDPWSDNDSFIGRINSMPAGTLTSDPSGFTWSDSSLLTLADSAMTLADSAMTLADSTAASTIYTIE